MKSFKILVLIAVLAGAAGGLALWWRHQALHPSTDDAYVGANVLTVAARVGGRVAAVEVQEHELVHRGQVLLRLQDDILRAELGAAQAAFEQAAQTAGAGAAQVAAAEAQLAQANAVLEQAQTAFDRAEALYSRGDLAQAALDNARTTRDGALAARDAAAAALKAAQDQLGAQGTENAAVRAAMARLEQARIALDDAVLRSPVNGWVANLSLRPGAMVAAGQPLFSIIEDGDWWVDANFKETDIARLRPGQPATVTIDMYPGMVLKGRVESIGAGSGAVFSLLPPQNATGNWVKVTQRFPVRIALEAGSGDAAMPLRVGASSTVTVDTTATPAP
ncbi:HlyD family secretion protein [Tabrizicola sp. YIM 78059]|uniref:HlyD family secretion protein n=1 Tax=Tabrizicola sp. YIM 78059 TaxID=2529861 RepID=UPI0010AB1EF1|nr:HlyD family secretion protein [Tabrizicola sp. YIM 78059]